MKPSLKNTKNPQIIIPDDVTNKISYLCKIISEVEWSGILLYTVKGSIKKPSEMVVEVKDVIPMDRGSKTFTNFSLNESKRNFNGEEVDDKHIDYCEANEEAIYWKMGLIHSHNTFETFFSATDMSELEDNIKAHNFYLSLIVNNAMQPVAKIATLVEGTSSGEYVFKGKDENGNDYVVEKEKGSHTRKKMLTYDCDIIFNREAFDNVKFDLFYHNIISIMDKRKSSPTGYNYGNSWKYGMEDDFGYGRKTNEFGYPKTTTPSIPQRAVPQMPAVKTPVSNFTDTNSIVEEVPPVIKYMERAAIKAIFKCYNSYSSASNLESALKFAEYHGKTEAMDAAEFCEYFIEAIGHQIAGPDFYMHLSMLEDYLTTNYLDEYQIVEDIVEGINYVYIADNNYE